MKKLNLLSLIFVSLLMFASLTIVKAQDETPSPDAANQNLNAPARPNLMRQLGLTQDQVKQIRQINQEKKPQMRAAQDRLREANRNLDQAIYADIANDVEIQTRLKQVQTAHADVIKIRSLTELAVRRILTPEQLVKFRSVRQEFVQGKENLQERINNRRLNAPNRNPNNRQRPTRSGN